jgi:hypothetical protein
VKSVGIMSALSSTGDVYAVLRDGTNTQIEFHNFIMQLDQKLSAMYESTFKRNLILIFDNAGIHGTDLIYKTLF